MPSHAIFKSAARRSQMCGACPALDIGGEVSAEDRSRKISAGGHEGGRGQWVRGTVGKGVRLLRPEGINLFQRRIFVKFCLRQILFSIFKKKVKPCTILFLCNMQQLATRARAPKHIKRIENMFRKNKGCLFVVYQ